MGGYRQILRNLMNRMLASILQFSPCGFLSEKSEKVSNPLEFGKEHASKRQDCLQHWSTVDLRLSRRTRIAHQVASALNFGELRSR
jgi:hypothetical protein